MQITSLFNPIKRKESVNQYGTFRSVAYPNLKPLAYDTVSFGAMKKSKFNGFNLAVINKFKAPISNFNSCEDFDKWAKDRVDEIKDKKYPARQPEATKQRHEILKEWFDYVMRENDAYTPSIQLLILDSITKGLSLDNDNIPPVLNKGVLADTISQIQENIKNDKRLEQGQINFNKIYQINLQNFYLDDFEEVKGDKHKGKTGWVVIPSYKNDPENFEDNVEKLKALSYKTWCTKSFKAEPYLESGDFHVYLDDGKSKLGVRFVGDMLSEFQGEKNDTKIPPKYFDVISSYIDKNKFSLSYKTKDEINNAERTSEQIKRMKHVLGNAIENKDYKTILEYLGISVEVNKDGLYSISEYRQPTNDIDFKDLGIDENDIFNHVYEIIGNANFTNSSVTDFGKLERIWGHVELKDSKMKSFKNVKHVGGRVNLFGSQIEDFGELESIGSTLILNGSKVTDLKNLKIIGGDVDFSCSKITDVGKLERIGGDAKFSNSQITDLKNLKYIGGNADFSNSEVTDIGELKTIEGDAEFKYSKITDLKNLEKIGGDAYFGYSEIINLGKLRRIEGRAHFRNSKVKDLGELEYIGDAGTFSDSPITSLGNLKYIGRFAHFGKNIKDIGKLEYIGGHVFANEDLVPYLNNIEVYGSINVD